MVKKVGDYVLHTCISSGSTSSVRLAIHVPTGTACAVKVMAKSSTTSEAVSAEVKAWRRVQDCPGVLQLREVLSSARYWYLVSNLIRSGNLLDLKNKKCCAGGEGFTEGEAKEVVRQVARTLREVHRRGVSHRDIKPENLLVDDDGRIVLCDFGLATFSRSGADGSDPGRDGHIPSPPSTASSGSCSSATSSSNRGAIRRPRSASSGSPIYAAPCVLEGNCADGAAADAWSLGVLLYWMLSGQLPFCLTYCRGVSWSDLFERIKNSDYPPLPGHVSQEAATLVKELLHPKPGLRATVQEVLEHSWVRGGTSTESKKSSSKSVMGRRMKSTLGGSATKATGGCLLPSGQMPPTHGNGPPICRASSSSRPSGRGNLPAAKP
jgi:serine/threonine protein kinase